MRQPPKAKKSDDELTPVEGKAKKTILKLPRLSRQRIEQITSPEAIRQQIEKMKRRGAVPSGWAQPSPMEPLSIAAETTEVEDQNRSQMFQRDGEEQQFNSLVDAVRWQDNRVEELRNFNTQDIKDEKPWIDDLLEDFIVHDLNPGLTNEQATAILKSLNEEIDEKWDTFGPEARNYIHNLKREVELLIEKLS